MSKKIFFASAAKAAFALAAVVMMSAVFTSCSKDNDDDNPPAPKAQTVTIDGTNKPIVKAEYENYSPVNYRLFLYLSVDRKEKVILYLNKDLHMTGKPIDLTKKEAKHVGYYWAVDYYDADGKQIIETWGKPDRQDYPVFKTGTLTMSGSPMGTINIKLENGRVKGKDGKEYTLILSYSGKMTAKKL